jgi:nicotinate-nucleotide adenylyltransferase
VCAQEAFVQLELDRVLFVPVGQAPHRELAGDPGVEARAEMVELAVGEDERFEVSRAELERQGPSFTADTLRGMREASPDDELFLILGGDQAATLPTWHEPEQVLSLATVAVVERSNWSRHAIGIKLGRLAGAERIRYLDMPMIQVSSSAVRRRVAEGRPVRYLVPEKVATYIESNGLYRASVPDASVPERATA